MKLKTGGFHIPLGYLKKESMIKASVDFMYISGERLAFNIHMHLSSLDESTQETLRTVLSNVIVVVVHSYFN